MKTEIIRANMLRGGFLLLLFEFEIIDLYIIGEQDHIRTFGIFLFWVPYGDSGGQ